MSDMATGTAAWRVRLSSWVFGEPGIARSYRRGERFVLPALLFVAGTVIALFRLPPSSWNILWAEDGATFVTGAYSGNPLVLFEPYSGYMHFVPRIVAFVAVEVAPLALVPLMVTIGAALVTGALATSVYCFARSRLSTSTVPLVLWLQVAILPVAGGEVADSIANSHWYLIFAAFWAFLVLPRGRLLTVLQCVVIALAVMSDPLTLVLLAPLFIVRVIVPGMRRSPAMLTFVAAGIVQLAATVVGTGVNHSRTWSVSHPSPIGFAETYSGRVLLGSIVGVRNTPTVVNALGHLAYPLTLVVFVIGIATAVILLRRNRSLILGFALASVVLSGILFELQWDGIGPAGPTGLHVGDRYIVVPTLLIFSSICVIVDSWSRWRVRPPLRWAPVALLALVVVVVGILNYHVWNVREGAPSWNTSLHNALEQCADGTTKTVNPPIAPSFIPGPQISCTIIEKMLR